MTMNISVNFKNPDGSAFTATEITEPWDFSQGGYLNQAGITNYLQSVTQAFGENLNMGQIATEATTLLNSVDQNHDGYVDLRTPEYGGSGERQNFQNQVQQFVAANNPMLPNTLHVGESVDASGTRNEFYAMPWQDTQGTGNLNFYGLQKFLYTVSKGMGLNNSIFSPANYFISQVAPIIYQVSDPNNNGIDLRAQDPSLYGPNISERSVLSGLVQLFTSGLQGYQQVLG